MDWFLVDVTLWRWSHWSKTGLSFVRPFAFIGVWQVSYDELHAITRYIYSLFHKKRYAFSQKVSNIFIPIFYVLTVRSKGYGATTDSFQSCLKCQILHNIKLRVLSTLNVTKKFFCAPMHADHIFHTQLLPKCLKSLSTSCKCG